MKKQVNKTMGFILVFLICVSLTMVSPGTSSAGDLETVTYRLKWLFNASVIGDIYADVHGHFKAAGLDVDVKAGGPERDAIRELELGHTDFGVASADQVIRALSKGSPVVVIAQLFQVNPLQWIYRKENLSITRIEDLKGKIVGITFGGNDETIMRTLMAKAGITDKDLDIFSVRYDLTPFYQKRAEVWPVYRNSQAPILEKKLGALGEEVAYFNPSDYGVKFVANSVVTSKRMLETRPDVVAKFITALLDGWEDSLDPDKEEQALKTLMQFDKDTAADIMQKQLTITRRLIKPFKDTRIGTIDLQAWQQTEKIMLEQKQISSPVMVEKVIRGPF